MQFQLDFEIACLAGNGKDFRQCVQRNIQVPTALDQLG
jgi:hypothetical protein